MTARRIVLLTFLVAIIATTATLWRWLSPEVAHIDQLVALSRVRPLSDRVVAAFVAVDRRVISNQEFETAIRRVNAARS